MDCKCYIIHFTYNFRNVTFQVLLMVSCTLQTKRCRVTKGK